ncbi:MAG: SRPBCC domain-containing protein, partial [Myxococcales bacterium]|nr:SRPBCC domain-containing protein [Myxococcales bacterium]
IEAEGRFFERAGDGREVDLGRVTVWEPGRRLVLDFYIPTGPEHPTEVTLTFTPERGGTRLHLHHEPTPRGLPTWERFAPRFVASWEAVLAGLVACA